MGKEAKVGLSIIGMLLLVLAGVVTYRLANPEEPSLADVEVPTADTAQPRLPVDADSSSLMSKMTSAKAQSESDAAWDRYATPASATETPAAATSNEGNRYGGDHDRYSLTRDSMTVPATGSDADDPFASQNIQAAATSEEPATSSTAVPATLPQTPAATELAPGPTMPTLTVGAPTTTGTSPTTTLPPSPTTTTTPPVAAPSTSAYDRYATSPPSGSNLGTSTVSEPATLTSPAASALPAAPSTAFDAPPSSRSTSSTLTPAPMPTTNTDVARRNEFLPSAPSTTTAPFGSPATTATATDPSVQHPYVVEGRENNFWTIAEKAYGNGMYYRALEELNRSRVPDPSRLTANTVISVPPVDELRRQFPTLVPTSTSTASPAALSNTTAAAPAASRAVPDGGRLYRVQAGDTLFDIARSQLGKAGRWAEIYDLNRDVLGQSFDKLQPGIELVLPGDASAVATRPAGFGPGNFDR